MGKVRKVDYRPDEYIAGVGGQLTAKEQGVYWMICTLVMSKNGPIDDDEERIGHLTKLRPSEARKVIDRLVSLDKISRIDGKLSQNRAEFETEKAQKRIETYTENGKKGGRPPNNNNELDKPTGFEKENPNHQPVTSNANGGGDAPTRTHETVDAVAVVKHFETLRGQLWPQESSLPAPRLTLISQARGYLEQGITPEPLNELIGHQMRRQAEAGRGAPTSINAFNRSLPEAIATWRKSQTVPTVPTGSSHGQRNRQTGHETFAAAAQRVIARRAGTDPGTGEVVGRVADDGPAAGNSDVGPADAAAGRSDRICH